MQQNKNTYFRIHYSYLLYYIVIKKMFLWGGSRFIFNALKRPVSPKKVKNLSLKSLLFFSGYSAYYGNSVYIYVIKMNVSPRMLNLFLFLNNQDRTKRNQAKTHYIFWGGLFSLLSSPLHFRQCRICTLYALGAYTWINAQECFRSRLYVVSK